MELRIIKADEYDQVVKLSEGIFCYDGVTAQDYFPQYFMKWASSSNHYIYGLFVNNELVAAKCDTLLDDGKTLFAQGLRVSKYHRGKGYAAELHKRTSELRSQIVTPRYPIKRTRYAKGVHDGNIDKMIQDTFKIRSSIEYMITRTGITTKLQNHQFLNVIKRLMKNNPIDVQVLSVKDAWKYSKIHKELFVRETFYTDWETYETSYENFIILANGGSGMFVFYYYIFIIISNIN